MGDACRVETLRATLFVDLPRLISGAFRAGSRDGEEEDSSMISIIESFGAVNYP